MKQLSVGIVACASMHEQIEDCLTSLEGSFRIYPIIPSCTFLVKIDLIRHYLDRSMAHNDVTLLAYGICHPQLLPLLAEYGDHVVRVKGTNCYEMFLGSEKYSEYHRKCYWMLNKPFFTKWKNEILTGFGAGTSNRRTLIGDTFKKLVYVRFEKDELSLDLVKDFARTAGLEYEIQSADTANLERLLKEALATAYSTVRVKVPKFSVEHPREAEMRSMIEDIGEVIYKVDVHTKQFTFVSPQVKGILGYTEAEFLDVMNDYVRAPFYHEDDRRQVVAGRYEFLVKCLSRGMQEPYEAEYRVKHKNGNLLWVRESIYPSYGSGGLIESFVGKIADITERKRMEEMLKESEEKLRLMFESANDGIAIIDLDGNLMQVNEAVLRMHGYDSKAELIGRSGFELFAVKDRARAMENIKRTLETGRLGEIEYRLLRRDGSEFDAGIDGAVLRDAFGNPIGFVVVVRDITERKKLEQLKDEFIGLVSHELRSPLTVITGAVNTVLTEGARLSPEETRQLLKDAALEAKSLSHLLGNLLELSRARANRLVLYAEAISIRKVILDTVEEIKHQSSAHQFTMDIPRKLPPVYADQLRLERVLYNLLDNAVKYSPQGSEVRVSAKPGKEQLVIGVSDQGPGISLSDQAKLFRPFQRLEESRLERAGGVGLGLLVCRRLVEAHGGRIWVESEPRRGSTFFFTIPLSHS